MSPKCGRTTNNHYNKKIHKFTDSGNIYNTKDLTVLVVVDDYIIIIVDSTGTKMTNRSQ